ncbi:alpha/beta fold hydrolase [Enterovibrio nigricans]|uniref:Pimeloyl-ACP methyl ester carboxylesterase n=1 Tax=Enterovibrio nigricans DSM 22720 TaxID=1121868 RepID=A0A1T4UXI9_9GAMM|nr:alpha/beta hydrolase [Enterovibrio nigricans]PKF50651.1 alpha/beta hydrolase [Enterovibrio nigricans]SKA57429.1 Pimeloyl-ACP methyl ester carboxylesterase [Enterovibrio nigricans DSM 22720]
MKTEKIILNGNTFRFSFHPNENTGQTVIFMFGALQDIESVERYSKHFSQYVNCYSLELPGTGQTSVLDSRFSIQHQSEMLLEFINHKQLDSVHLIVFSYATAVAVELCKIWPNVLSMSVCCGVPGVPVSGRPATKVILGAALQPNTEEFASLFTKSLTVEDPEIPRNSAIIKATEKGVSKLQRERIDMFFENTVRLFVYSPRDLSGIRTPTTVLVGEADPYVTVDEAKQFSNSLPSSQFLTIKNADHFIHLQHPKVVAETMIERAKSFVMAERTLIA